VGELNSCQPGGSMPCGVYECRVAERNPGCNFVAPLVHHFLYLHHTWRDPKRRQWISARHVV
jgi:hypothetical protein